MMTNTAIELSLADKRGFDAFRSLIITIKLNV